MERVEEAPREMTVNERLSFELNGQPYTLEPGNYIIMPVPLDRPPVDPAPTPTANWRVLQDDRQVAVMPATLGERFAREGRLTMTV